jgi:hypothetical protein
MAAVVEVAIAIGVHARTASRGGNAQGKRKK